MLDRSERWLKFACAALAVLLLFQIVRGFVRRDPLSRLTIPALPTLPVETNASPASASGPAQKPPGSMPKAGTNIIAPGGSAANSSTNLSGGKMPANMPSAVAIAKGTNAAAVMAVDAGTNTTGNQQSGVKGTNGMATASGTNSNSKAADMAGKRGSMGGMPPGMAMMGMGGPGGAKAPELPLPVQARVFRITDSEILGPVIRPMPTALLGIVGDVAFIRAASGQSGVVKEGDSVGALKLVKIGTNRVLVEEDGQKKELMIFSGYGGESIMPKQKDNSQ